MLQVPLDSQLISSKASETADLGLLLHKSTLCFWTVEHPFWHLANSTLRRDWNFDLCLHQVSLIRLSPILFSSFCSCFLFAIGAEEAEFLWHNRERWNDWYPTSEEDSSIRHVWNFLMSMSAIWCLVFGVNVPYLNLKIPVDSVRLWLSSQSRLRCPQHMQHSIGKKHSNSKAHCQHDVHPNCRVWLKIWFDSLCTCLTWCDVTSHPALMNRWFKKGTVWNGTLPSKSSTYPPLETIHPYTRVKRNYLSFCWSSGNNVSCTCNLLEQMCDFRNCTMFLQKWVSNLRDLLQNQNHEKTNLHWRAVFHTWQNVAFTCVMNVRNQTCKKRLTIAFCKILQMTMWTVRLKGLFLWWFVWPPTAFLWKGSGVPWVSLPGHMGV